MEMKLGLPRYPSRTASSEQFQSRRRFRFRFSLRGLLLLVSAIALWLGWLVEGARRQQEAVAIIRREGGYVGYDYVGPINSEGVPRPRDEWPAHRFLRKVFGDDVISSVNIVSLGPTTAPDVLLRLPRIELLHLYCTPEAIRDPSLVPKAHERAAVKVVGALPSLKHVRLNWSFTFADAVNMQRARPGCAIMPGGGPMTSLVKRFDLRLSRWRDNPCVEADGDDYLVYSSAPHDGVDIKCLGNPLKPPLNARVSLTVVRCPGHMEHRKPCELLFPVALIEASFLYEDDTWSLESDGWRQTWAAVKVLRERPNVDVASIAAELARQFGIVSLDEVVAPNGENERKTGPDSGTGLRKGVENLCKGS